MSALTFPADLTDRYYFDLKFKTYSRPSPYSGKIDLGSPAQFAGGLGLAPGEAGAAPGFGNIRLPIPSNVIDTQRLNWAQASIDGALNVIPGILDGSDAGAAAMQSGATALGAVSGAVGSAAFGTVGDAAAMILQRSGLALNPVLTQMFKHPEFKQHQFSWTLAPETDNESYVLQSIIDLIKQQALPDIVGGGAFFSYPSIAMIQMHTGNNGNLYNFQPCVITGVSVNYAPRGVPSFFAGTNAPTLVTLDIQFLEIILNTRSNMKGENVSGFDFSLGGIGSNTMKEKAMSLIAGVIK